VTSYAALRPLLRSQRLAESRAPSMRVSPALIDLTDGLVPLVLVRWGGHRSAAPGLPLHGPLLVVPRVHSPLWNEQHVLTCSHCEQILGVKSSTLWTHGVLVEMQEGHG